MRQKPWMLILLKKLKELIRMWPCSHLTCQQQSLTMSRKILQQRKLLQPLQNILYDHRGWMHQFWGMVYWSNSCFIISWLCISYCIFLNKLVVEPPHKKDRKGMHCPAVASAPIAKMKSPKKQNLHQRKQLLQKQLPKCNPFRLKISSNNAVMLMPKQLLLKIVKCQWEKMYQQVWLWHERTP